MAVIMAATDRPSAPLSGPAVEPGRDYGLLASSPGARMLREVRREIPGGLQALEARVAHDLACLNYPPPDWVPPTPGPAGTPILDVMVAGGGMCGQTVAYALRRDGIGRQRWEVMLRFDTFEAAWTALQAPEA
jgi:hypothetical protein